jgi:uncharacterized heparinase superfamily protein
VKRLLLYANTLRHLRLVQWLYMPLRRVQARLPLTSRQPGAVRLTPAPALAAAAARLGVDDGERVAGRAQAVLRREFTFLGRTERLPVIEWDLRHVSHLWSYNLHYFDYAQDLAWAQRLTGDARTADAFVELALSWVAGTQPGRGDGWEPYAVSLRLVNWIKACLLLGDVIPTAARRKLETSMALQAAWLERRLERHIQANHLQKNFHALAVAGLCLEGSAAARWRRTGLRGSWAAVREQVLADGGHYERSPMYHAVALQDFLELMALAAAAGERVPEDVGARVGSMVDALGVLSRPAGSLHLFNDAAHGIAPSRAHLDRLAQAVLGRRVAAPDGAVALPESGYYGYIDGVRRERLLVDCGEPGPRHQPGHAHCGLLGFELDVAGRPLVVDAGVHGYDGDPFREYVRSTRAHNTVMIGGREQSEVWGTFRMARRARVLGAGIRTTAAGTVIKGRYRPYHARRSVHARRIEAGAGRWRITDRVEGARGAPLHSFLHLHPDWTLVPGEDRLTATDGTRQVTIRSFGADAMRMVRGSEAPVQGWYCPEFGRALPAAVLELTVHHNDGREFGYEIEVVHAG